MSSLKERMKTMQFIEIEPMEEFVIKIKGTGDVLARFDKIEFEPSTGRKDVTFIVLNPDKITDKGTITINT